ncbi:iron transporter [Planomonospora parontospora subsp. parontospora]|uniref:Iron transporter n=2 Tax=Planomonospora parontospora TaxID=58119 RepID=A0AA37BCR9_9ACTN|nr:iron uptake transporter permease EfeU [Planomonospora parontospora]GGK51740.1 iron transporter [Planomonospora parontospora]GII06953.1 iron transporter [Planomonospora parontospora subsp. parontospora]
MLASYLIGLREGLEAALVVSILVAFLVKSDRRDRLPLVWAGVGAAAVLSVAFGALLTFTAAHLDLQQQELFEAVVSITATVFVTSMIFWMRTAARRMSGELREKLGEALRLGPVAVVVVAFLAVAREGLETTLLWFAAVQGATTTASPLIGITLGLLTSVALGWGLYRSALRINLTTFFTWTGLLLILVAAGILKYGVHDLQEAGFLPGLNTHAFDISGVLDPGAWYSMVLGGMFNVTAQPSVLETVAWVAYAVPVLVLFLWPGGRTPAGPAPQSAQAAS